MRIATARLRRYPQRGTKNGRNLPIKDHGGAKRLAYRVDKYASAGRRQKVLTQVGSERVKPLLQLSGEFTGAPPPPRSYIFPSQGAPGRKSARHSRNEAASVSSLRRRQRGRRPTRTTPSHLEDRPLVPTTIVDEIIVSHARKVAFVARKDRNRNRYRLR